MKTILHIKNMVCPRCKIAVQNLLEQLRLPVLQVELGEVAVAVAPDALDYALLGKSLKEQGFELIFDQEQTLCELIKAALLLYLGNIENEQKKLSVYLADRFEMSYSHLSHCFSKLEKITIEKYFILLKIEKIKELLSYKELSISIIAKKLGYSSGQALSAQFKSVMGITASEFKATDSPQRKSLDDLC